MTAKPATARAAVTVAVHLIYCSNTHAAQLTLIRRSLSHSRNIFSRCNSQLSSRLYLRTTWVSQTPLMPFALSVSDSNHSLCCALFPNAESLKLCSQSCQQQINESSLEAHTTCTPTYHLQLDRMPCTLGKSDPAPVQNPTCNKTNYTRTDLIFWVCMALRNQSAIDQKTFYHVHSQALL